MVYNLVTVPFELAAGSLVEVLDPVTTIGLFGGILVVGSAALLAAGAPFGSAVGTEPRPASAD